MEKIINQVIAADGITSIKSIESESIHLILSDIPYGIGIEEWDVLHSNTNTALLGTSPAQEKAGAVFRHRGKPLNGWSAADKKIPLEYQQWCSTFASEWLRVIKPGGSAFVFAGRRLSHRCVVALEDAGFTFKDSLAWIREAAVQRAQRLSVVFEKRGDTANAKKWEGWRLGNLRPLYEPILWFVKPYPTGATITDNVLEHEVGAYNQTVYTEYEKKPDNIIRAWFHKNEDGYHIAQKPIRLLQALIELTTKPNQIVLDPFCGSGSTLVAAKVLNRRYIGYEINKEMVSIAKERLENQCIEKDDRIGESCLTFLKICGIIGQGGD